MESRKQQKGEWALWAVAISCGLHATEEYFTGWQKWAIDSLGINVPVSVFLVANAALVIAALGLATLGWSKPRLSLIIPGATLVNGIFFHILPTLFQDQISPGVYTSLALYVPFSSWCFVAAARSGVSKRAMLGGFAGGCVLMLGVVVVGRLISR